MADSSMTRIFLDAGHGGSDFGAVYGDRAEKNDALDLTMAVGDYLSQYGFEVVYDRIDDVYHTPYQKAENANNSGADLFISIHRNSSPYPNQYNGVESLVYNRYYPAADVAASINRQLEMIGWRNAGVNERPNLVVLRQTNMPAVLIEVGFINTDEDNVRFDETFDETAQAIARGIAGAVWNGALE